MFCFHKWNKWHEVSYHLERKCLKCGKIEKRFPHPLTVIAICVRDVALKALDLKLAEAYSKGVPIPMGTQPKVEAQKSHFSVKYT